MKGNRVGPIVAGMAMMAVSAAAPGKVVAQGAHAYLFETVEMLPVDPARPWGWAVRAFMQDPNRELYNTAKAKLLRGEQVFSHTVSSFNIESYCAAAPRFDFTWFEMQHSTLSFRDIEQMVAACPRAGATPMIRMADASEANIQQAMDIGMLGIIIPTVDDALEARQAAMYARFPPVARRSSGGGQSQRIWQPAVPAGSNWRNSINDNMLVVVMIETIEGVQNALEIASQPGVDVVILGNADLSSFSGVGQQDPKYQDLLIRVRNATYLAGKFWGNASFGMATNPVFGADSRFHQNAPGGGGGPGGPGGGAPGGPGGGGPGGPGGGGPGGGGPGGGAGQ